MRTSKTLAEEALVRVRQNITDHAFLEIQRDAELFRDYIRLVAKVDAVSKFGEVNRQIARYVKSGKGMPRSIAKKDKAVTPMSSLIQSFTCFDPNTVEVKAESK